MYLDFEIDEDGIYNCDCLLNYDKVGYMAVDAIITDLPYGTTQNKWDAVLPFDKMWEMIDYVLKPNGVFITTSSQPFTSALIMSNPKMFKYCWYWNKNQVTNFLNSKKQPLRKIEEVVVFYKKQCKYNPIMSTGKEYSIKRTHGTSNYGKQTDNETINNGERYPDGVINIPQIREKGGHPTQKPIGLMEYLVKTYTNKFDLVFDPCAGSGTTALACENLSREYICFEKDVDICNKANERLNSYTKLADKPKERGQINLWDNAEKQPMKNGQPLCLRDVSVPKGTVCRCKKKSKHQDDSGVCVKCGLDFL